MKQKLSGGRACQVRNAFVSQSGIPVHPGGIYKIAATDFFDPCCQCLRYWRDHLGILLDLHRR